MGIVAKRSRRRAEVSIAVGEEGLLPADITVPLPPTVRREVAVGMLLTLGFALAGGILLSLNLEYHSYRAMLPPVIAFAAPFLSRMLRDQHEGMRRWRDELRDFQRRHPVVQRIPRWRPSDSELWVQRTITVVGILWLVIGLLAVGGTVMTQELRGAGLALTVGVATIALVPPAAITFSMNQWSRKRWSRRNSYVWWRRRVAAELQQTEAAARLQWRTAALTSDGRTPSRLHIVFAALYAGVAALTVLAETESLGPAAVAGRAVAVETMILAFAIGRTWPSSRRAKVAALAGAVAVAVTTVAAVLTGLGVTPTVVTAVVSQSSPGE